MQNITPFEAQVYIEIEFANMTHTGNVANNRNVTLFVKDEVCRRQKKNLAPTAMGGELLDALGIAIAELPASKLVLFKEQSHRGRVIVASKHHVSESVDLPDEERAAFLDDVNHVAKALHEAFHPDKINYGAYGDDGHHLHFHLCPKYRNGFEWKTVFAMNPDRVYLDASQYRELAQAIIQHL